MGDTDHYEVRDRYLPAGADPEAAEEYAPNWDTDPDAYAATVREVMDPELFFGYQAPSWQRREGPDGLVQGLVPGTSHPAITRIRPELFADPSGATYMPHPEYDRFETQDLLELNAQPYPLSQTRPYYRPGPDSAPDHIYNDPEYDEGDWEDRLEESRERAEDRAERGEAPNAYSPGHAPLHAFAPGQRDVDVMWRWVRGMRVSEIEERAEGWERLSSVLANAEGVLRNRGEALREAWHSAADGQSAADTFLEQIGGTMYSMGWWWSLANTMARDLETIAGAIEDTREKLGPIYAHYQVALALWNNWGELSGLPNGTELYLTGVQVDGYELPPPGIVDSGDRYQRGGEVFQELHQRMRINNPEHPDWHPGVTVLYDQHNGESTDKDIQGPEDILEAYHQRAAEAVQPLANLYNNAHAMMPTQDPFRGPNPLELALPLDPSDLTSIIDQMADQFGAGGGNIPGGGVDLPPGPPFSGDIGPVPVSIGTPTAGAGIGPGVTPVDLPGFGAASTSPSGVGGGGLLAGIPTQAAVSLPAGGGPAVGFSAQQAALATQGAAQQALAQQLAAQQAALTAQPAATQQPLAHRAQQVAVQQANAQPVLQNAQQAAQAGAAPVAFGQNGSQPAATPVAVAPVAPTGVAAQPVALPGVTPAVVGSAELPVDGSAPVAAGAEQTTGMMMPPPPPPVAPPVGTSPGGRRAAAQPTDGIGISAMPPPPSPLFVPPGRVTQGVTATAPRQVQPTLAGAAARPARATGLNGTRGRTVNPPPSQRAEPAPAAPATEQMTVPGVQDSEVWTVRKPKGLLQSSAPPAPARHGKAIGSAG